MASDQAEIPGMADTPAANATASQTSAAEITLTEDALLGMLQQPDLSGEKIESLARNSNVITSRKVKMAVIHHPRAPRHVTLPLLRQLFTFDLMNVALSPSVPADLKNAADDVLISRLESISAGERLTLARRASGQVAGSLLLGDDPRILRAALDNSRLTEALVIKAVNSPKASAAFVEMVCAHSKWSVRKEVRIALLRSDQTSLASAVKFARSLPILLVREILQASKLGTSTKRYLRTELNIPD